MRNNDQYVENYINMHTHDAVISPSWAYIGIFCHFDYKTTRFIE